MRALRFATATATAAAAAAAMVRQLLTDAVLPGELLPADRPAPTLRATYTGYRSELTEAVRTGHGNTGAGPCA